MRQCFLKKPLLERFEPVLVELSWSLRGSPDAAAHKKLLPDYCYNILDVFGRTYFKAFRPVSEIIQRKQSDLSGVKSIEEAKKAVDVNWRKLGVIFGLGERMLRFASMEAEGELRRSGILDMSPEEDKVLSPMFCSDEWLEKKKSELGCQGSDDLVEKWVEKNPFLQLGQIAE